MTTQGSYQTILVAVTASAHSLEAVSFACALARGKKSAVIAVHVIEVSRSMPLDANLDSEARKAEQVLRKAEELASAADYHLSGELLQARDAGTAIVDEAKARGADLIILGISYDHHGGSSNLGRVAEYVLRNATAAVLIFRQSAAAKSAASSLAHHGGSPA